MTNVDFSTMTVSEWMGVGVAVGVGVGTLLNTQGSMVRTLRHPGPLTLSPKIAKVFRISLSVILTGPRCRDLDRPPVGLQNSPITTPLSQLLVREGPGRLSLARGPEHTHTT